MEGYEEIWDEEGKWSFREGLGRVEREENTIEEVYNRKGWRIR